jgi:hypothetical protein
VPSKAKLCVGLRVIQVVGITLLLKCCISQEKLGSLRVALDAVVAALF